MKIEPKSSECIKPIRKRTIPQEVIRGFRALMESGDFLPGDRLPSERELALKMNISRNSLREGLRTLNLLGMIVNRPGKGTFITAPSDQWPSEPLDILLSMKKGTLLEILEARKGLESTVAALAAERRNKQDLQKIEEALKLMEINLYDPEKYSNFEVKFHMAVVGAAKNSVIASLMTRIYRLLVTTRNEVIRYSSDPRSYLEQDYHFHKKIFEYIELGDRDMACKAMIDHILPLERRLKDDNMRKEIVFVEANNYIE
jgi:GntR family transcriptional repressor for pyruvate dehydrogenase complex